MEAIVKKGINGLVNYITTSKIPTQIFLKEGAKYPITELNEKTVVLEGVYTFKKATFERCFELS